MTRRFAPHRSVTLHSHFAAPFLPVFQRITRFLLGSSKWIPRRPPPTSPAKGGISWSSIPLQCQPLGPSYLTTTLVFDRLQLSTTRSSARSFSFLASKAYCNRFVVHFFFSPISFSPLHICRRSRSSIFTTD